MPGRGLSAVFPGEPKGHLTSRLGLTSQKSRETALAVSAEPQADGEVGKSCGHLRGFVGKSGCVKRQDVV
jgi:hypothetical protein